MNDIYGYFNNDSNRVIYKIFMCTTICFPFFKSFWEQNYSFSCCEEVERVLSNDLQMYKHVNSDFFIIFSLRKSIGRTKYSSRFEKFYEFIFKNPIKFYERVLSHLVLKNYTLNVINMFLFFHILLSFSKQKPELEKFNRRIIKTVANNVKILEIFGEGLYSKLDSLKSDIITFPKVTQMNVMALYIHIPKGYGYDVNGNWGYITEARFFLKENFALFVTKKYFPNLKNLSVLLVQLDNIHVKALDEEILKNITQIRVVECAYKKKEKNNFIAKFTLLPSFKNLKEVYIDFAHVPVEFLRKIPSSVQKLVWKESTFVFSKEIRKSVYYAFNQINNIIFEEIGEESTDEWCYCRNNLRSSTTSMHRTKEISVIDDDVIIID